MFIRHVDRGTCTLTPGLTTLYSECPDISADHTDQTFFFFLNKMAIGGRPALESRILGCLLRGKARMNESKPCL